MIYGDFYMRSGMFNLQKGNDAQFMYHPAALTDLEMQDGDAKATGLNFKQIYCAILILMLYCFVSAYKPEGH